MGDAPTSSQKIRTHQSNKINDNISGRQFHGCEMERKILPECKSNEYNYNNVINIKICIRASRLLYVEETMAPIYQSPCEA